MNRRDILRAASGLTAVGALAACKGSSAPPVAADPLSGTSLMRDVETYVGFGIHRSGGAGDLATTDWFAKRWAALGYEIEQQHYEIPNADTTAATLSVAGETFDGFGQPPLVFTSGEGLPAPLAMWDEAHPENVAKRIAVVYVPAPSSGFSPSAAYRAAFAKAADAGAAAVLGVISGPSGEIVAINTPVDLKPTVPVLLIGEREKPRLDAAMAKGGDAVLRLEGPGGMRPASNTIARHGDTGPWLIVSTPQSGWFTCGGERGPGVAMSLALAEWAVQKKLPCRLCFVSNSGHEWIYFGGRQFQKSGAPEPADTAMWFHLGASYAARAYEQTPDGLKPLDTANPNCVLMVSDDLMASAQAAFAGQPGIGTPAAADVATSAGELTAVIEEGYKSFAGFWGGHALFHTPIDKADATTPQILETVARSVAKVIEDKLA
ncbi:MAG: hypothetical protein GC155_03160 [Alphaproteobacteria bacterium]|nr:hypothetical protein [Alphaproteobacteria bacterium]